MTPLSEERALLFVYGTLLDSQVVQEITGREFETVDAFIEGCYVAETDTAGYPEIREGEDASKANGKILLNVDVTSLKKLDDYEGTLYVRREALAKIKGKNQPVKVNVYVRRLNFSWWLPRILRLVGGNITYELGNASGLREKCRSSLTSVGLVFVLNVCILSALLISQIDSVVLTRATNWELLAASMILLFALALCWFTDGFRTRLLIALLGVLLPFLHYFPAINLSPSSALRHGSMAVAFISALYVSSKF